MNFDFDDMPKLDKHSKWRWLGALFSTIVTALIVIISWNLIGERTAAGLGILFAIIQVIAGYLIFKNQAGGYIVYNLSYGVMIMGIIEMAIVAIIGGFSG